MYGACFMSLFTVAGLCGPLVKKTDHTASSHALGLLFGGLFSGIRGTACSKFDPGYAMKVQAMEPELAGPTRSP